MRAPSIPQQSEDDMVIAAMRAARATSPRHACRARELPPEVADRLPDLLERGLVREGAPGTYYLYVPAGAPAPVARRFPWRRVMFGLFIWLALVLIPIAFIRFTSGR